MPTDDIYRLHTGNISMQDKTPGPVDLKKRNPHTSIMRPRLWAALIFLMLLVAAVGTFATRRKPPEPAATVEQTREPAQPALTNMNDDVQSLFSEEGTAKNDEELSVRETARGKVCRSLAAEFVERPSPTREQQARTLMLFSVNSCNNGYLADADAAKRGLTPQELEAMEADTSSGPLEHPVGQ